MTPLEIANRAVGNAKIGHHPPTMVEHILAKAVIEMDAEIKRLINLCADESVVKDAALKGVDKQDETIQWQANLIKQQSEALREAKEPMYRAARSNSITISTPAVNWLHKYSQLCGGEK